MTKFKIKETYLLMLIVIGLVSLGIYTTYALFTASTTINDVVGISTALDVGKGLTEYEIVTVNPSETKLIELNIVNSYSSTIYYGAWYQIIKGNSSDIDIGLYTEKNSNPSSGSLATNGSINLLAGVTNNGDTTITIYIGAKGSINNELNLGDNKVLLPSDWSLLNGDLIIQKFNVDGTAVTAFPTSGNYEIDTSCDESIINFNYESRTFEVSNIIKKRAKCDFNFTTISSPIYLNDYIKSLTGTTQGTGQVVNENGYRYEGKIPNNYIIFNNELWRIIGVFDTTLSDNVTIKSLVKIIRNDVLGKYINHESVSGVSNYDWNNTYTYEILNNYYYNASDGENSEICSYTPGECNFIKTGIKSSYRNMIENVLWYLGDGSRIDGTPDNYYLAERSKNLTTSGNVGLMYLSDYAYGALPSCMDRTITFNKYNIMSTYSITGCSWLYKDSESFISKYYVCGSGFCDRSYSSFVDIRPVVYLKSNVIKVSGDGSMATPYIISY